jgi:hypothetical protein
VLEAIIERLRPGSKGESVSKVATTGQEVASQAATLRIGRPLESDPSAENWTVAVMGREPKPVVRSDDPGETMPWHAPDDPGVLRRMFRLDVPDI